MKKTIILLFFLLIFVTLSAQNEVYDYGKTSGLDFSYSECPFDKEAEAVVLFDKGESRFVQRESGFRVIYERTTRIKILKEAGIRWANIEMPYYESNHVFEKVYNIEAIAYNIENNKLGKTVFNGENSFNEKINENWHVKKYAVPNVKVGTIIDYKYSIESDYIFNLRDWEFQWKIPVIYSEYKVKMVPFYQYSFLLQGATKFYKQSSVVDDGLPQVFGNIKYNDMIHTYAMKNIVAFKDEEFITSTDDYILKLDFQLAKVIYPGGSSRDIITTWPLLVKDMVSDENFGKHITKCEKLTPKILNPAAFAALTQQQKFDSVINFVKKNYRWNKNNRVYTNSSLKDFNTNKYGNSAEINLFAIGLLRGVGINAYPVILSTREHGKIKTDYPFIDFFNSVVIKAEIDSAIVLSDATDILLANNRIPISCINGNGLVIQKDKVEWLNLQSQPLSKSRTSIVVNLNESKSTANIGLNAGEYDGVFLRKKYGSDRKAIDSYFAENEYTVVDSSVVIKNMESASSPYLLRFAVEFEPERINNKLYFAPFFKECIQKNPLKQQNRTYPIDMIYVSKRTFNSTVTVPKGYKTEFIPAPKSVKNDLFEMEYLATQIGNNISVSCYYCFKKPVYEANNYLVLKSFYNDLINKANEKIVFVKE